MTIALSLAQPTPNVSDVPYFGEQHGYLNAVDGTPLAHRGAHFEIVGGFNATYAEVFWKPIKVPFPASIQNEFAGKILAITGFETQVVRMDASGKEAAVPCSDLYNHHWNLFLEGADGRMSAPELQMEMERHKHSGFVTSCWSEKGVTFAGETFAHATVPTVDDCCTRCRATKGCKFWSFGLAKGDCALLSSDG
eukprot:SAG31_NODE_13633_length_856_cov_1.068692_1_plen_193_part_10